jgi:DNA invertase Pin-like site-specific DNA recombinase
VTLSEDDLKQAGKDFRDAPRKAAEARDKAIRQAKAEGWGVVAIANAMGLSRETIRLVLNRPADSEAEQDGA